MEDLLSSSHAGDFFFSSKFSTAIVLPLVLSTRYHFFQVRDSGIPSFFDTADVTIAIQDYNDNPPVFSPVSYAGQVREDVIPEVFLLQVSASDSDTGTNQEFEFSIFDGDPDGHFRIDPKTGNLYVHRKLDRETWAVYLLTVRATNTGTV